MSSLLSETYNPKNGTMVNTTGYTIKQLFDHYIYIANRCIVLIINSIDLKSRKDIDTDDIKNDTYMKLFETCSKYFHSKNRPNNIIRHMTHYANKYIERFNSKIEYIEKQDKDIYYYINNKRTFESFEGTLREALNDTLLTLTPREQKVIELHFFEDMNFKEIGNIFNVTNQRTKQIEAKALRKLRHPSRSRHLKEYLQFI